ncbi:hypothetical protein [Aeromonas phage ZPAH34]|nr:hypothetical protein PQD16_gp038 [Aeromonas phage ZPAH34]UOX39645.1 hypothetical protein [Aeromonas phage ZPAH34]
MTIANVFFGSIGLVVFGSLAFHYYKEWKENKKQKQPRQMARFNEA